MSVTVHIPTPLRRFTGEADQVAVAATTALSHGDALPIIPSIAGGAR